MGALEDTLKKYEREYFELLEKCVGINSYTYNVSGINTMGQVYAELYRSLGFDSSFSQSGVESCGKHVISIKKGKSPKNILLVSHIDTVYSETVEKQEDHYWKQEGNIIYGPGTVDIKGGSIMIYLFLKALKAQEPTLFETFTWKIIHNATEEIAALDFKDLLVKQVDNNSLACLVYEGSCKDKESLEPILLRSRKGSLTFEIKTIGRAAHSSTLQNGANAIREMSRLIEKIESQTDFDRGMTFSVGLINGGTASNTVPDLCTCKFNVRVKTVSDFEYVKRFVDELNGSGTVKSVKDQWSCHVHTKLVGCYPPWPTIKEHDWLVEMVQAACAEGGRHLHVRDMGAGASDGNNIWEFLPVVDMLGPVGGNHHCPTNKPSEGKLPEFIDRNSIVPQAAMNIRLIQKIAKKFFN